MTIQRLSKVSIKRHVLRSLISSIVRLNLIPAPRPVITQCACVWLGGRELSTLLYLLYFASRRLKSLTYLWRACYSFSTSYSISRSSGDFVRHQFFTSFRPVLVTRSISWTLYLSCICWMFRWGFRSHDKFVGMFIWDTRVKSEFFFASDAKLLS